VEINMLKTIVTILVLVMVATGAVAMALWWHWYSAERDETHTVESGTVLSGVTVSGTLRCREKTAIASEILAAVKSIEVVEGQEVAKDQRLILLDDSVLAAECAKARARVVHAREYVRELEAGPRDVEIREAREAVKQAESELAYAEKDHKHISDLVERGGATQRELELAATRRKVSEAKLGQAKARVELLKAGAREEQRARAKADVKLAEAEVQRCEALATKYVLRAPHAGIVTAKYVNVGEVVAPGQVLLRVDNVLSIEVLANAQETQLSGIARGSRAHVLADAYPDTPIEAVVEKVLPRVDPESGTVTCILRLVRPPTVALMDGMAVDISMVRQQRNDVVRVPVEAVVGDGDDAAVWVRKGGSFEKRQVQLGLQGSNWAEITSGLSAGEVIRVP
jgi:multidrug efflux pump subunit AcrA (membrane-fusion protein)